MLKFLFVLFSFLFFVSPSYAQDFNCSWNHGGYVETCANMADRLDVHPVRRGRYASAGVMILHNASCIERGAIFFFHSASYPNGQLSSSGNEVMEHFLYQWPVLVYHLRSIGAFESRQMTRITAEEMTRYGVPLCR